MGNALTLHTKVDEKSISSFHAASKRDREKECEADERTRMAYEDALSAFNYTEFPKIDNKPQSQNT